MPYTKCSLNVVGDLECNMFGRYVQVTKQTSWGEPIWCAVLVRWDSQKIDRCSTNWLVQSPTQTDKFYTPALDFNDNKPPDTCKMHHMAIIQKTSCLVHQVTISICCFVFSMFLHVIGNFSRNQILLANSCFDIFFCSIFTWGNTNRFMLFVICLLAVDIIVVNIVQEVEDPMAFPNFLHLDSGSLQSFKDSPVTVEAWAERICLFTPFNFNH